MPRCCGDGDGSTVCRTTVTGIDSRATSSRMSSPSLAAEDAELVLDDDRVEVAENFGGSGERVGRAANPLGDDAVRQGTRLRLVDAADDAGVGRRRERAGEGCSEGCESALRRRVRADEPDRPSGRLLPRRSDLLCAPSREQLGAMRDCRDGGHVPSSPGAETATDSAPTHAKSPGEVSEATVPNRPFIASAKGSLADRGDPLGGDFAPGVRVSRAPPQALTPAFAREGSVRTPRSVTAPAAAGAGASGFSTSRTCPPRRGPRPPDEPGPAALHPMRLERRACRVAPPVGVHLRHTIFLGSDRNPLRTVVRALPVGAAVLRGSILPGDANASGANRDGPQASE